MKTANKSALAVLMFVSSIAFGAQDAQGQFSGFKDLMSKLNPSADQMVEREGPFQGFKKIELPKPMSKMFDLRWKKPELPKFEFVERLKSIGQPNFNMQPNEQGPIMAGLTRMFQPRDRTQPGFLESIFSRNDSSDGFAADDDGELASMTKGLQQHVDRMSREVRTNATELFTGQASPQPPLRTARQYSGQESSRY